MKNIKQILRTIIKHKSIALLLLVSLSIGLTAYILISAKVFYNKSYDTHLDNYKSIYRIVSLAYTDNALTISQPRTQRLLGQTIKEKHPEVKQSGYLCNTIENHYKIDNHSFTNDNGFHCSKGFVDIFSVKIIHGNLSELLTKPNTVIISESFALQYFGSKNPIGEIIHQYPARKFEIEAVFKDFPIKSHVKPDFLISFHDNMHLPPPLKADWGEFGFYTYLEFYPNSDINKLENEITQTYNANSNKSVKKLDTEYKYSLQAIEDIHTKSHLKNEISQNIRGDYLNILHLISIFILIISGFNYIYFSYTRISSNSLQYGVKKVLGAKNSSLLFQFMVESLIIHSFALILAFLSIWLMQYLPINIYEKSLFNQLPVRFWISLSFVFVTSCILNPVILLLMLFKKNALTLITQKFEGFNKTISFKQVFVIIQFAIIVFLISSIIGIDKQVKFLIDKNKGFDIVNKLVIKKPSNLRRSSNRVRNLDSFEQELLKIPGVSSVSVSSNIPGDVLTFSFSASEQKDNSGIKTALLIADNVFIESFQIDIIEGKDFTLSERSDCIINTVCMKQLGYEYAKEIIGKNLFLQDESMMQTIEANIIGVCNDFNFTNTKETPDPVVLLDWTKDILWENYTLSTAQNLDSKELISQIESHYNNTFPDYPLEYFWLEDYYNSQFDEDNSIISSLKNFATIAILLGVLSLFSMVWHMSISRTKEIGIRKINGAKKVDIIIMLNYTFVKWIGLASFFAVPLSWLFLSNWLNSFTYKTDISIWIFLISSGIAMIIGIITVISQSLKVANLNPVESIKYE